MSIAGPASAASRSITCGVPWTPPIASTHTISSAFSPVAGSGTSPARKVPSASEAVYSWGSPGTRTLIDAAPVDVKGQQVSPRDVAIAQMHPRLFKKDSPDLVALRVVVNGTKGGKPQTHTFELVDRYDAKNGISAMMRTTGYSLSITGQLQAMGQVQPNGVHTPDECMPGDAYATELGKRGILIRQTVS